jgi:hypothetical protein
VVEVRLDHTGYRPGHRATLEQRTRLDTAESRHNHPRLPLPSVR